MRILLDEQLPRQLVPYFKGHDARTVQQQGWAGLKNSALLRQAAVGGFEAFITSDQNIQFQQNLRKAELFVVVLMARTNKLEDLLVLVPSGYCRARALLFFLQWQGAVALSPGARS